MNLEFFDSYPYRTLEPDLQALVLGAAGRCSRGLLDARIIHRV